MPTYIEILSSKPFMETVSDDIDNKYSYSQINSMVSYTAKTDTNILSITAKSTDSHDAYLIAESVSHNAPDEIRRVFEGGSVKLINNAEENTSPLPSNALKRGLIGFVAGAALAALIIFLINIFDTRVKSSEELTSKYGLPILGEIPNLHEM
jgi:capsular polysaccharide biosynthesis protein